MEKDEKAGFKPSNHHKYRVFRFVVIIPYGHTNATIMLRNAVPAKIVSSMLGHSTIGITLDTYSHVLTDMQEGATGVMNELLSGL